MPYYWQGTDGTMQKSLVETIVQGTTVVGRRVALEEKRAGDGSPPISLAALRNPVSTPSPTRVADAHLTRTAVRVAGGRGSFSAKFRDADKWLDFYAKLKGVEPWRKGFRRSIDGTEVEYLGDLDAFKEALTEVHQAGGPSPDFGRVCEEHFLRLASVTGRTKTAGEVRFIKDRGGDKNEWAWGTPGPSNREIGEDFAFKVKYLKPLSVTLRATLMAMGHAISAQNTFAKIKSADVSPDGNLGGKGYIQKVADMRRAYMNVVEALSALSDTLHDEIKAPHWDPEALDGGSREREEVQSILQDAAQVEEDPEGWAEEEEAEMEEEREEDGEELDEDPLPDDPPEVVEASTKSKRGKRAALALSVALQHLRTAR